eukprot:scaffold19251_cov124-Skeletonema_marinoi.AAC.2
MHGLVPCARSQPPGFVNAFIHEFNLIYGRLNVLHDRDAVAFACKALLAVFKFIQEKYDTVWNDRANLNWTVSFFLANGTQHLLDGNDSCAREYAFISYVFEQRAAVFVNQSRTINWPKLLELYIADHHTLASFFRKRINCSCLDKLYKKVKSIPKIGVCYNPYCKHGRVVTRSETKCCSQCRREIYCSRRCQAANWPRHREACIETAAVLSRLRNTSAVKRLSRKALVNLDKRSIRVTDSHGNTPLHCACLAANYNVIELLLAQYPTVPVGERNSDKELPIQLLLEHSDQENAGYMSCMFLLLRANPEMGMDDMNLVLACIGS